MLDDGRNDTTGAYLEDVHIGPGDISINFDRDSLPTNEAERRAWMTRQIAWMTRQIDAINVALVGRQDYGVTGLKDSVYHQRIWLIFLTIAVLLVLLLLFRQQVQIGQILYEIGNLTRIP